LPFKIDVPDPIGKSIQGAPPAIQTEFKRLLNELAVGPFPNGGEFKKNRLKLFTDNPDTYGAHFDSAILAYWAEEHWPTIYCLWLAWIL
jgi:hypothetical protein